MLCLSVHCFKLEVQARTKLKIASTHLLTILTTLKKENAHTCPFSDKPKIAKKALYHRKRIMMPFLAKSMKVYLINNGIQRQGMAASGITNPMEIPGNGSCKSDRVAPGIPVNQLGLSEEGYAQPNSRRLSPSLMAHWRG